MEQHVDHNVIYGMYSGLALLMDVYRPEKAKWLWGYPRLRERLECAVESGRQTLETERPCGS